jgi:methionyl-tRNA formyltransferase
MGRALAALARGALVCRPQPETGVTYAAKIDKAETRITWARPAQTVLDHVRGLSPFPGAWCEIPTGSGPERIKVLRASLATGAGPPGMVLSHAPFTVACGEGAITITEVQRAGKKPIDAKSFLMGARLGPGLVLA